MTQQYFDPRVPNVNSAQVDQVGQEFGHNERKAREIVAELWENTEKLVRQELELASAELDEKVDRLKADLVLAAVGGAVAYAGLLGMVAALVLLLSKAIAAWLAALLVGVAIAAIGYALLQRGKRDLTARNVMPEQTQRSLKRTAHTLEEAVR